jgi:hypothetical protein
MHPLPFSTSWLGGIFSQRKLDSFLTIFDSKENFDQKLKLDKF